MNLTDKLHPLHPERAIEWLIGIIALAWGSIVLFFPTMFENQPALYGEMLRMMPQPMWGLIAFAGGLLRLGALYVNGNHYRTPLVRVVTSFLSMFVWFFTAVGSIKTGMPQAEWAIYPVLMLGDLWSVYRASSDVYESNAAHKRLVTIARGMKGVGAGR